MQPKFISPAQIAEEWDVTRQQVMKWLKRRRIPGARRTTDGNGRTLRWNIPASAKKPAPERPGPKTATKR